MSTITRRSFVKRSGAVGGGLVAAGPLGALIDNGELEESGMGYALVFARKP